MCRVFINSGCNRHRQTSRPVTGAEIQTSYYFEENLYDPNCLVDLFHRRHINLLLRSSCKVVVRRCNLTSLSNYLIFVLRSFFSFCVITKSKCRTTSLKDNRTNQFH